MYVKGKNKAGCLSINLLFIVLFLLANTGYAQTKNDCPFCYLKGKNFAGKDLTNVNFNGACLDSADFTNARLDGANFSNANLIGAKFSNAKAAVTAKGPVNFSLANCTGANFSNTSLKNAVFYYANLSCVNFTGADLTTARMGPELKVYNSCPAIFKGAKLGCAFIPFVYILNLKDAVLPSCMVQPVAQAAKEPAMVIVDIKKPADPSQTTLVTATREAYGNRDTTRANNPKNVVAAGDTLYVSNLGTDTSTCGAAGSPCKTIAQAVTNCGGNACTIAVDYGEYTLNASVSLKGINLVGGFYNGQPTTYQSALLAPPGGLPVIIATGGAVTISNFILNGSIPTQKNLPSIVLQAQGGSNVTLSNTNINSFKGGMGSDGAGAGAGSGGNKGGNGNGGAGGGGGTSACGNNTGGAGGCASYFTTADCHYVWSKAACYQSVRVCWCNGGSGQPGSTGVSASGSTAAAGVFYFCGSKERPSTTATGAPGTAGSCGGSANPATDTAGKFVNGQWTTVTGGTGGVGGNGGGGGGGGAGGYCAYCGCFCGEETYNGTAGGGGGAGGCGAAGGTGANMGGASFGIVLINATLVADNTVKITNGAGGDGGTGGVGNSGGTGGGGGSAQQANNVCNNTGGQGGAGGAGGVGGASGGGAGGNGGPSIGVALVGTSTCSNKLVFYAGKSGSPGGGGAGGNPNTGATCYGGKGNGGIPTTVANTYQY